MFYFSAFIDLINSLALNLDIIRLIIDAAVAAGTMGLAFMAYKQIKESIIARKRVVALELASIVACVLAYIKDCYGLVYPALGSVSFSTCTSTFSTELPYKWFEELEDRLILLSNSLNDKFVKGKLGEISSIENIYRRTMDECSKIEEDEKAATCFEEWYSVMVSILEHLVREYGLSLSEIKRGMRGLLSYWF